MQYAKYHALGNDYLVIRPSDKMQELSPEYIRRICHRHYGVGSDGILFGPLNSTTCNFRVRIFNPDGSEAEKSGNGLRIFARFLHDAGLIRQQPFTVETLGGNVSCLVQTGGQQVQVEMGEVCFDSTIIPVLGKPRQVLDETIEVDEQRFTFCAATVGNPHCIILTDNPTPELACRYGPLLEINPLFPNRTNVQFMKVLDNHHIQIEIWERGAGYTLASGSSSTAAAAVAYKLGLCESDIGVHMPGGLLQVQFTDGFHAILMGPVTKVCEGMMSEEMFSHQI